jgi:hypothetical protein
MKPSTTKKISIPNTLNIVINTSIPGFQSIKYKPNMTIPDFKSDNSVSFDPLIELEKKVIDKVPQEFRVKQFFNRGLFNSLLNLHNKSPLSSLNEAVYYGYVDNNIGLTLDTLFPVNGLIYIDKQPYRIADIQWRKGDWRITPKVIDMPRLDPNKVTDPFLYQSIIQDELISGEEQLSELPDNVVFGPNYNVDSDPTAQGRKKKEEVIQEEREKIIPLPSKQPLALTGPTTTTQPSSTTSQVLALTGPTTTTQPSSTTSQVLALPGPTTTTQRPALPALPAPPPQPLALPAPGQEQKIEELDSYMQIPTPDIILNGSSSSTAKFRELFKNMAYYTMLRNTYDYILKNQKIKVKEKFLASNTPVEIKIDKESFLTYDAYKKSLNYSHVYSNRGGGDCFFLAVADGINYYNHRNPANRIIYKQYGKGSKIFTQNNLREVLADYILSANFDYNDINIFTSISLEEINNNFSDKLKRKINELGRDLNEDEYIDLVNNVYLYNNNFLIDKPEKMPNDEKTKNNPFTVLPKEKVRQYVSSSYCQGNETAVKAMSKMLGLNIIPLSINKKNKLNIPFSNFKDDEWSKYMFLYYTQGETGHYELIGFDNNIQKEQPIIFNKEFEDINPPFYILYMIFGCSYLPMNDDSQNKFAFLKELFQGMQVTFNFIYKNIDNPQPIVKNRSITFLKYFAKIFDITANLISKYPALLEIDKMQIIKFQKPLASQTMKLLPSTINYQTRSRKKREMEESELKKGGQAYYSSPYNRPPNAYRGNPSNYGSSVYRGPALENLIKKEDDKSNLSYYVEIDMELKRGKEPLSSQEIRTLKCQQKWNSVRRSYAEFTGQKYVIPPVYEHLQRKNKTEKVKRGGKKSHTIKKH